MRALTFLLLLLAIAAAMLNAGCAGQGQQSLPGMSMDWRSNNAVPSYLVGQIVNQQHGRHQGWRHGWRR